MTSDLATSVSSLGVYGGALVGGVLSSIVPFVIADVLIVGAVVELGASPALVAVLILTAIGQAIGKLPMVFATRGALALAAKPSEKMKARLERIRRWTARFARRPRLVLAISALTGVPPFAIIASAAAMFAVKTRDFVAIVFGARLVRFAIVAGVALAARN